MDTERLSFMESELGVKKGGGEEYAGMSGGIALGDTGLGR